jgi:hypothetical protein
MICPQIETLGTKVPFAPLTVDARANSPRHLVVCPRSKPNDLGFFKRKNATMEYEHDRGVEFAVGVCGNKDKRDDPDSFSNRQGLLPHRWVFTTH